MRPSEFVTAPIESGLMPIGSEKSDDSESDNRHKRAKSDHNEVEHGHDAPNGRFTRP
jgi:hypothetical protein